jgi:CelD/BcsL family acetyltransferase involved in cellulose biosynthesis
VENPQLKQFTVKVTEAIDQILITMRGAVANRTRLANVQVLTSEREFEALAAEWDELLDDSDQRVFFLRWFWNRLWWEEFRPAGGRLYLIVCRDQAGRLHGLAPLYWQQRTTLGIPHVRDLRFIGTGVFAQTSEYLDIIARRGSEREVAETIAQLLESRDDWDRLWLREAPSTSLALSQLAPVLGPGVEISSCNRSHHIDATTDWDTFVESLSRSTRKHLKRQTRKFIEKYDCRFRRVESESELDSALDALVRLHQARWISKGQPGSFSVAGFEQMVRRAARAALSESRLRLWTLELNGKLAAVRLAFCDDGIVHAIQGGFDPAYTKESLGSVMLGMCIKDCLDDPLVRAYDFMGGTDSYKDWWTKLGRDTQTLTYLRPGLRTTVYNLILGIRRLARSAAHAVMPLRWRKRIYETVFSLRRSA